MATQPHHEPARKVGGKPDDIPAQQGTKGYPDIPAPQPGLTGGPATEAVPGSHGGDSTLNPAALDPQTRHQQALTNPMPGEAADGSESVLEGRPRETGGTRPPKSIPKTEGS